MRPRCCCSRQSALLSMVFLSCCCSAEDGFSRCCAAKAVCASSRSTAIWRRISPAIGDTMAPIKFGVGQSVLSKEDDALIRGKGRYTDDHAPQASLHALVLRSPHAHAKFTIDAGRARGLPGVAAILTAEDVKDLGSLPCLFNLEVDPFTGPPYPILANGEVRHVGDPVAFAVAETIDQARDAIEAIEVN